MIMFFASDNDRQLKQEKYLLFEVRPIQKHGILGPEYDLCFLPHVWVSPWQFQRYPFSYMLLVEAGLREI